MLSNTYKILQCKYEMNGRNFIIGTFVLLLLPSINYHTTKNNEMINLNIQGLNWNPEDHRSQNISGTSKD